MRGTHCRHHTCPSERRKKSAQAAHLRASARARPPAHDLISLLVHADAPPPRRQPAGIERAPRGWPRARSASPRGTRARVQRTAVQSARARDRRCVPGTANRARKPACSTPHRAQRAHSATPPRHAVRRRTPLCCSALRAAYRWQSPPACRRLAWCVARRWPAFPAQAACAASAAAARPRPTAAFPLGNSTAAAGHRPHARQRAANHTAGAASAAPARRRVSRKRVPFENDPSAGSPTETLLRLLLPLNDKVC